MMLSFEYWYMFPVSIAIASLAMSTGIAMFTAPGVLIGGQIGPKIQAAANPDKMKVAIAMLFMGVGALMLVTLTK